MTWDLDTFCRTHGLGDDAAAELRDALAATLGGTAVDPDDSLLPAGAPVVRGEGRDHLSLRRLLGQGAMGEVWLAHDERLSREVALKLLGKRLAHDDGAIERFLAEARSTAQLVHPGIVPVHEVGTWSDGRPFYTMDVIRGTTLTDELATLHGGGPPEPGALHRAVERLRRACEAVGYAHARGVVHRDLKPDNIMIGPFGETLVADWGLVRASGQVLDDTLDQLPEGDAQPVDTGRTADLTQGLAGTPRFMSPEQVAGVEVRPASDVFSLGAILVQVLDGRPAFPQPGLHQVLAAVAVGQARIPTEGPAIVRARWAGKQFSVYDTVLLAPEPRTEVVVVEHHTTVVEPVETVSVSANIGGFGMSASASAGFGTVDTVVHHDATVVHSDVVVHETVVHDDVVVHEARPTSALVTFRVTDDESMNLWIDGKRAWAYHVGSAEKAVSIPTGEHFVEVKEFMEDETVCRGQLYVDRDLTVGISVAGCLQVFNDSTAFSRR